MIFWRSSSVSPAFWHPNWRPKSRNAITVTFVCKDKVFQQNDSLKSMQYEAAKRLSIALILMSRFAEKPILSKRK